MNTKQQIKKRCVSFLHSALKEEKAFLSFASEIRKEKIFPKNYVNEIVMYHDTESRRLNLSLDLSFPYYRA